MNWPVSIASLVNARTQVGLGPMQDSSDDRVSHWYILHFMVGCATGFKLASSVVRHPVHL